MADVWKGGLCLLALLGLGDALDWLGVLQHAGPHHGSALLLAILNVAVLAGAAAVVALTQRVPLLETLFVD